MHIIERTPDGYAWTVINTGEGVGFHPGCTRDDGSGEFRELPKARPAQTPSFASRSVRRALLMPQVHPGSLYRCGKIN